MNDDHLFTLALWRFAVNLNIAGLRYTSPLSLLGVGERGVSYDCYASQLSYFNLAFYVKKNKISFGAVNLLNPPSIGKREEI